MLLFSSCAHTVLLRSPSCSVHRCFKKKHCLSTAVTYVPLLLALRMLTNRPESMHGCAHTHTHRHTDLYLLSCWGGSVCPYLYPFVLWIHSICALSILLLHPSPLPPPPSSSWFRQAQCATDAAVTTNIPPSPHPPIYPSLCPSPQRTQTTLTRFSSWCVCFPASSRRIMTPSCLLPLLCMCVCVCACLRMWVSVCVCVSEWEGEDIIVTATPAACSSTRLRPWGWGGLLQHPPMGSRRREKREGDRLLCLTVTRSSFFIPVSLSPLISS